MTEKPTRAEWGVVPQPLSTVLQRLQARAAEAIEGMDASVISGGEPRNHDAAFLAMSEAAEAADRATRDYRSIFNAYVHKFHQPKPPIGQIAAMQGTIIQSFAKRYTGKTIAAIDALLSPHPDLNAIRDGIRSLGFEDLRGVSEELDAAMRKAEQSPGFTPWQPVLRANSINSYVAKDGSVFQDRASAQRHNEQL